MDYFNLHTHQFTNRPQILELVNQYPDEFDETIPFYSVGIHPWRIIQENIGKELLIIEDKLKSGKCLALGECGLDKRIDTALNLQADVFEKQLLLAQKYRMPVIVHCVAAFQEIIEIKQRLRIAVPMIVHGFSKNAQVAKSLTDNGFYISFGKYLLRNPELRTVFQNIPDDRFFLETDTAEEGIAAVYQLAAAYKNLTVGEIISKVNSNFQSVFRINTNLKT